MSNFSKSNLIFLGFLFILESLLTLFLGEIPWSTVYQGLINRFFHQSTEWNSLLDERIPRLIVIISTGASLALSGAIMQSLFHNPLASPSVLGIDTGGCLGVMCVIIFNFQFLHPLSIPLSAFIGCLSILILIYILSLLQNKHGKLNTLILTGIATSTLLLSIQGVILYAYRNNWQLIQSLTEWLSGSTLDRGWEHVHMQLPLTLVGILISFYYRKEMNLLALGEEEAKSLGVNVHRVRWHLFLATALLTGGSLAAVGLIAFFGLVTPHILRLLVGPDHKILIPLCIIIGAILLLTLDLFMRTFSINRFSIGNLSAILGGFFFFVLLFRANKEIQPT